MEKSIQNVLKQIAPYIHRTPVFTSSSLDEMIGCKLYFKCENFQRMGAFKFRGAMHALLNLSEKEKLKGVITHSSGNFAQALSLAAKLVGIPAYIVMPENAPKVKIEAVKGYGGIITFCPASNQAREEFTLSLIAEKGLTFIHPSNDYNVILGQGTAAFELIEDVKELDYIVTPVGGGGLIAGTILASEPADIKVVGGEPIVVNDAYRSLLLGQIEYHTNAFTIADGLRTHLGDVNFPIIKKGIDCIICVEESEIISAMKLIWERMNIIVEPSSAVALAAVIKEKDKFKNLRVGIILSGGNVDLTKLPF